MSNKLAIPILSVLVASLSLLIVYLVYKSRKLNRQLIAEKKKYDDLTDLEAIFSKDPEARKGFIESVLKIEENYKSFEEQAEKLMNDSKEKIQNLYNENTDDLKNFGYKNVNLIGDSKTAKSLLAGWDSLGEEVEYFGKGFTWRNKVNSLANQMELFCNDEKDKEYEKDYNYVAVGVINGNEAQGQFIKLCSDISDQCGGLLRSFKECDKSLDELIDDIEEKHNVCFIFDDYKGYAAGKLMQLKQVLEFNNGQSIECKLKITTEIDIDEVSQKNDHCRE